jgi:putative aldouronate transport system permease protein
MTGYKKKKIDIYNIVLFILLTCWGIMIVVPFLNVIAISLTSYKEYLETPILLFPKNPTLKSYAELIQDSRIWTGYKTTLTIVFIGVPLSLFVTATMAYGLSKGGYPGRKLVFILVIVTMIFQGGIVPLYLVMKTIKLTNSIWSVILARCLNTFYMILMFNYFKSLPESLMESARLDGAGEWRILFKIVIPLSLPIIATMILFYTVDKWNEWFNAMIFIRKMNIQPIQLVLRSIVIESQVADEMSAQVSLNERSFTNGIKMAAVIITMLPIMCVYPFLQKHYAKGVIVGAIKA